MPASGAPGVSLTRPLEWVGFGVAINSHTRIINRNNINTTPPHTLMSVLCIAMLVESNAARCVLQELEVCEFGSKADDFEVHAAARLKPTNAHHTTWL